MTNPYESTTDPTALNVPPQGWGEWHAAVGADIDVEEVLGVSRVARIVSVKEGGLITVQFAKGEPRSLPIASGGLLYSVKKILAAGSTAFGLAIWE